MAEHAPQLGVSQTTDIKGLASASLDKPERHAKTQVAVAKVWWIGVAGGAAAVGGGLAPPAPTDGEAALWIKVARIGDRLGWVFAVVGGTELPDVAEHIVEAKAVGPVAANRGREGMAVIHRHDRPRPVGVDLLQGAITD